LFDAPTSPEISAPAPAPAPAPSEPADASPNAISFDDFGSGSTAGYGQVPAPSSAPASNASTSGSQDLLAIFDDAIGHSVEEHSAPAPAPAPDSSATAPSIDFGFGQGAEESELPTVPMGGGVNDLPAVGAGSGFSFDAPAADPFASAAENNQAVGFEQDFETDVQGQTPSEWKGDYPFAKLTVQSETPPRGSQQYACFEKNDGVGKALFTRAFPKIEGKVGIEFDLCCNDKNKFLLGVYVERDGDFQHAIHTKILRSEAQTTPTIHLQGESAPYLLGSWARIKYVVDLTAGKLDSFIDNTRVGRDVPLEPNPGYLNTISIRDNINTTGVLMLDNIKIYPIA
jgi:hypothetical protein